jgi:hypothetical protein
MSLDRFMRLSKRGIHPNYHRPETEVLCSLLDLDYPGGWDLVTLTGPEAGGNKPGTVLLRDRQTGCYRTVNYFSSGNVA